MFKIFVVFLVVATGQVERSFFTADDPFTTQKECRDYVVANQDEVRAKVEAASQGRLTIKAECQDVSPKEPA